MPDIRLPSWLASALLGAMAVAFTAWAAAVWDMGQNALTLLNKIRVDIAQVQGFSEQTRRLIDVHGAEPWHDRAGTLIEEIRREQAVRRDREARQNSLRPGD